MKYTLAVAVLIGTISAAEPVWSLRSVNDHRTDSEVQKAYGDHSTTKANGRPPYQSAVQVNLNPIASLPPMRRTFNLWVMIANLTTPRSSTTPGMPLRTKRKVTTEPSQLTSLVTPITSSLDLCARPMPSRERTRTVHQTETS